MDFFLFIPLLDVWMNKSQRCTLFRLANTSFCCVSACVKCSKSHRFKYRGYKNSKTICYTLNKHTWVYYCTKYEYFHLRFACWLCLFSFFHAHEMALCNGVVLHTNVNFPLFFFSKEYTYDWTNYYILLVWPISPSVFPFPSIECEWRKKVLMEGICSDVTKFQMFVIYFFDFFKSFICWKLLIPQEKFDK